MSDLAKRIAKFISDHDAFGDHFSAHELALLDPSGGYDVKEISFAWVIEKGPEPRYYAPTEPSEWTRDHMKACRFSRKEDAEAVQFRHVTNGHLPEYGTRVAEHGWWIGPSEKGGPAVDHPDRPTCKPDGSCCDFVCGN